MGIALLRKPRESILGSGGCKGQEERMTDTIVVFITVPDEVVATSLARALVEERLAACVNRVPGVRSTYFWQGKLCEDSELLLVVKTRRSLFEPLRTRVRELHPYTVPEIIALPIALGHEDYLTWIAQVTRP
jgi:periplasmic divalent cation tolerance protein